MGAPHIPWMKAVPFSLCLQRVEERYIRGELQDSTSFLARALWRSSRAAGRSEEREHTACPQSHPCKTQTLLQQHQIHKTTHLCCAHARVCAHARARVRTHCMHACGCVCARAWHTKRQHTWQDKLGVAGAPRITVAQSMTSQHSRRQA